VRNFGKVAVLGAGTMGSRIAAHLANAGVPSLLLDIVPQELTRAELAKGLTLHAPEVRNRLARAGLDAARKSHPSAFFVPEAANLVTAGNLEDNFRNLQGCDWIIEAITEDLRVKRSLLERIQAVRARDTVVSSNTSGISVAALADGFTNEFRRHFLGTHFFNPPRYLHLMEIIPGPSTLPEIVESLSAFGDIALGKGIVIAKDTPNFIANRIGTFSLLNNLRILQEEGYTVEEIDLLTGRAMGMPKSGTFRTLDIVGLDVLAHVVRNLRESLPDDECRDLFQIPHFLEQMLSRNWLGEKTGQGFYKKVPGPSPNGSEILALDLDSFDYRARRRGNLPALEMARNMDDLRARAAALYQAPGRCGRFYRRALPDLFHYAAMRVPEISEDIVAIDNAMKWGFKWECGVFELWDAIGLDNVLEEWARNHRSLPPLVERLQAAGGTSFYAEKFGTRSCFDLAAGSYCEVEAGPGVLLLPALKARRKQVKENAGASLIDLGDGVLCLEFHSKMNTLGPDSMEMVHAGLKALNRDFDALVIGNQAPNFCAGANLMLILAAIQKGEWDEIHNAVQAFQKAHMALKYAPKPVVAAPFGMTLGGGVEMCLHSARIRAAAECYMGLVETGVGLIPAGGGAKELLLRAMDAVPEDPEADPFTYLKEVFVNIGTAKVSTSAEEARCLRYLAPRDSISMNGDRLIADAKQLALDLVHLGYRPGTPREDIRVLGQAGFAKMKLLLHLMQRAEYLSEYDVVVGTTLARVLSGGGEFTSPQWVSEQYLLDLEREAFVSLCGQKKTVERIQYTLKKGKPLRN